MNINHRQVFNILKNVANEEFKTKKPEKVEIRRIKTYAIFSSKAKSLIEWLKIHARYIMCSYYPNQMRIYFLTDTGHMYGAITLEGEELKKFVNILKKKTKLIYTIKEITPHEPSIEELAQRLLEHISKTLKYVTSVSGSPRSVDIPPIKIIDKRTNDVGFFGCSFENGKIEVSRKISVDPYIKVVSIYASYYLLLPSKIKSNISLSQLLAYSLTLVHLTREEIIQIKKFLEININAIKIPSKREIKRVMKVLYLVDRYSIDIDIYPMILINTIEAMSKESALTPLMAIRIYFNDVYTQMHINDALIILKIIEFLLGISPLLKEIQPKKDWHKVGLYILTFSLSKVSLDEIANNGLLEDALEFALDHALDISVSYNLPDIDEGWELTFTIKNKTDLPAYNVQIVDIKWIPKNALELKEPIKSIPIILNNKTAQLTILFKYPSVSKIKFKKIIVSGKSENELMLRGYVNSFIVEISS